MKRGLSPALAIAATLLVVAMSWIPIQRRMQTSQLASAQQAALITEISDQHIATLAANQPPEVISSDRHTVKPWFQGKIPFSFNLPDNLPSDTNSTEQTSPICTTARSPNCSTASAAIMYLSLCSRSPDARQQDPVQAEHSGFHVIGFQTNDLEVIAVSDVDPARLASLVHTIEQAQTPH